MSKKSIKREPRFPGIDWYCDRCGDFLNDQRDFDDHKYVWKCKKCGYKTSLSWDNYIPANKMTPSTTSSQQKLLFVIGLVSAACLYTSIVMIIGLFIENRVRLQDIAISCFIGWFFLNCASIMYEKSLRHWSMSPKIFTQLLLRNLREDLFAVVKLSAIRALISNIRYAKRYGKSEDKKFENNILILHIFLLLFEITLVCYLTHFGPEKLMSLINTAIRHAK